MATIGLVTVGQAPRTSLVESMFGAEPPDELVQAGALDGLDAAAIAELAPRPGELPLVTQLRDGSEVIVAKQRVLPYIQRAADRVVAEGAAMIVVLCTGEFKELKTQRPTIYPDKILLHTVEAVLPTGTVGVLMPHPNQMPMMRARWTTPQRGFVGAAASPYTAADQLAGQARELTAQGADLIVLDCMGFSPEMKRTVGEAAGVPTIQANRLVGRIVQELVGA